jgi:very-short-patch-repair endonuclease
MKEYLSHYSAAREWNIPNLDDVLGEPRPGAAAGISRMPRDVTVTEARVANARRGGDVRLHLCSAALPRGAIARRNGMLVASPELVFLDLANDLDIHRLIYLGLQLCSHPAGRPEKSVTTKRRLESFVAKAAGRRGHRRAARALQYIEGGSASPMESLAFMVFTLPHSLGGYGLRGAVFNHEIPLDAEQRRRLRQKRCYADLYYRAARVAVEYDSFRHHRMPADQARDMMRAAALERQGISVIRFGSTQIYNREACEEFARNLATRLGKRVRPRSAGYGKMQDSLRALLGEGRVPDKEPPLSYYENY